MADFGIDAKTGFFPSRPLEKLPEFYSAWEHALASANDQVSLGEDNGPEACSRRASSVIWRETIRKMNVLDTRTLGDNTRLLQRAHHVLAYLVHFYVHSDPAPSPDAPVHVPASLAIPLVDISTKLGIAPVLTFADTVLWNYELIDPRGPVAISNMRCPTLFTRFKDEEAFYLCSAGIELRGVEALLLIDNFLRLREPFSDSDREALGKLLADLTRVIDDLKSILESVRPDCRPTTFYHCIRPWFKGCDANGANSAGWVYDGVKDSHKLDLSGPSAGQSCLMHAIDAFLVIDHALEKHRTPVPSPQNRKADLTFMSRMQRYMPKTQKSFLEFLAALPVTIRDVAEEDHKLTSLYNDAVGSMKEFRNAHMKIATLYIISQARRGPPGQASAGAEAGRSAVLGTGGNELSLLLKAGRDATSRAALPGPN
ncbi:Indoleamine 2,3-dioxygenase [Sistotremastrum suecicum HHB10207 ss-3]|uniref:Indoleamine 2,3-dioxygenase n=1 Tax=Sistotremastrum suecicum HHB10207 ss-3 TaxID=1314776 RepID=A0A166E534_9AGAM|nr:Indoleamine 2,3-dioxygenase [Sistotremastrum suecicum HHB10207 ss-3]